MVGDQAKGETNCLLAVYLNLARFQTKANVEHVVATLVAK
jgi:hypothetical protein